MTLLDFTLDELLGDTFGGVMIVNRGATNTFIYSHDWKYPIKFPLQMECFDWLIHHLLRLRVDVIGI